MKRILFTLGAMFLFAICYPQNVLPDSIQNQIRTGMKGFMERYNSPSITVAIVYDQKIIFGESMGYTDIENKIPATVNSKYPILSVTKPFTATMLMQLKEKGVINIDDDVRKYVPELDSNRVSPEHNITFLQLATHTSGLPRNSQACAMFDESTFRYIFGFSAI